MRIGVIGAGPVGLGIATLADRGGDDVLVATRRPGAPELRALAQTIAVGDARQAAGRELVVTAVLHSAARDLLTPLEPLLAGKVVIDAMNPWLPGARRAPGCAPARPRAPGWRGCCRAAAWSGRSPTSTGTCSSRRRRRTPGGWAAGYAADDDEAAEMAEALIMRMGYTPVRVGDLAHSAALDPGGRFFGRMLRPADMMASIG